MSGFSQQEWAALKPLLDEMLDLSPAERGPWLERQRPIHPDLVGQLQEMIEREAQASAEGFLGDSPVTQLAPASSLAGQTLGGYVLEQEIGRGGMGSVWLARRADGRFHGNAAIKFLSLAVAGIAGEARFRREGSVLARLTHPNIARLLDAGITGGGQPYLVLEYVDGQPIDRWCREHNLSVEARIQLFLQVLAAVGQAHSNLVVHRDLKPSNILVTTDGTVKLLDFGIAKLIEGDTGGTKASALTGSGEAMLTFEYAAPEQIKGEPITTQTDVYSLGVVLYQLVAGKHPTGANCTTPAEHVRATLETEPAHLAGAGDVDTVLGKALRKDPVDRYATVAAFADDLEHYLNHEPVSARPDAWTYRARKFVRRHRGSVGTGILTIIALIGAAIVTTFQAREARRQRDEAVRESQRASAALSLQRLLSHPMFGPEGQPLTPDQQMARSIEVLKTQYKGTPWLAAEVMINLANTFAVQGNLATQRAVLLRAQQYARSQKLASQLANASCNRSRSYILDEMPDSAHTDLAEAKTALRGVPNGDEAIHVCLAAEGLLLSSQGETDSAIPLLRRAVLEMASQEERAIGTYFGELVVTNDLGLALRSVGRTREAAKYHLQVIALLDSSGYLNTDQLSNGFSTLQGALKDLGEYAVAESTIAVYVAKESATNGFGRPQSLMSFVLANSYLFLESSDSADVWLARAARDTSEDAQRWARYLYPATARLRLDQHRPKDAEPWIRLIKTDTRLGQIYSWWNQARLKWELGDHAGALQLMDAKCREFSGDGPKPPTNLSQPLVMAAEWHLASGDIRGADSVARVAREAATVDSLALTRSAMVGQADYVLARALLKEGDVAGGRREAASATTALSNGFGPNHRRTIEAKALSDSLTQK